MSVRQLPTGPLSGGERPFLRPRSKVRKWRISAVQAVTPKARLRLNRLLICAWRIEAACKRNDRFPYSSTVETLSASHKSQFRFFETPPRAGLGPIETPGGLGSG